MHVDREEALLWKRTGKSVLFLSWMATLISSLILTSAWAKAPGIPKQPTIPPPLTTQIPRDSFRCQRFFLYKGQRLHCDSNIRLDGENLRPILEDVPEAAAELDLYQKNRAEIGNAAYIGTLGLFVAIAGSLLSLQYREAGNPTHTSQAIRTISMLGGAGIMIGNFISTLSLIRTNETHIGNAVNAYNRAHPDTPIELQFNTTIQF